MQFSPPTTEGVCSDYLDAFASTFDRLIFVISLFAQNGFYVVLDNQLNSDPTLILDGQDVWLGYWRQLATAVAADEYAVNKVIIDGLNVGSDINVCQCLNALLSWLAGSCMCYHPKYLHATLPLHPLPPGSSSHSS